jgi:hypothetical protein
MFCLNQVMINLSQGASLDSALIVEVTTQICSNILEMCIAQKFRRVKNYVSLVSTTQQVQRLSTPPSPKQILLPRNDPIREEDKLSQS